MCQTIAAIHLPEVMLPGSSRPTTAMNSYCFRSTLFPLMSSSVASTSYFLVEGPSSLHLGLLVHYRTKVAQIRPFVELKTSRHLKHRKLSYLHWIKILSLFSRSSSAKHSQLSANSSSLSSLSQVFTALLKLRAMFNSSLSSSPFDLDDNFCLSTISC